MTTQALLHTALLAPRVDALPRPCLIQPTHPLPGEPSPEPSVAFRLRGGYADLDTVVGKPRRISRPLRGAYM